MKRVLLIGVGLLVGLPLLAVGGFLAFFDADAFRPRLEAAVTQATGRAFRVEGPLTLRPALVPTLGATGLVLANVEGGTAPEMLRVRRAELRLALLPLLSGRIEMASLELEGGALLLERDNWRFARPVAPPDPNARPTAARAPLQLDLRAVTLRDWTVTAGGEAFRIPRLRLTGSGLGQPYELAATLIARQAEILLDGRGTPAGGRLVATLPGARVTLEAAAAGADWRGTLVAEAPQLAQLSRLVGRELPALTGVTLRAAGGWVNATPLLESLDARIASGAAMGVTLGATQLTMAAWDGPARLEAAGRFGEIPFTLTAEGAPAALRAGTATPVALRLDGAGAGLDLRGSWPGRLRLEASAPDLAALSPRLPPLREVRLSTDVARPGPGRIALSDMAFASSGGDMRGGVELGWAPRPSLRGRLAANRLQPALFQPTATPAAPAPAAPVPSPAAPGPARLIPDIALDLAVLRGFDADLTFEVGEWVQGTTVLRDVAGRMQNTAGVARLDPFAATLPAGRLNLRLAADATASPPAVQLAGGGQGLNLALLVPNGPVSGNADLDMDLRGQGVSTRALAATATGHLGLAVTEGALTGGWARAVGQLVPGSGTTIPMSCAALRWNMDRGMARTRVFYLEGAPGRAAGEGTVNLQDESIAARLSVDLRVAGVRVRAPVPVSGTLAAPRLEAQGLLQGALAGDLGEQLGRALPGLNLPAPNSAGPALPECGAALRVARGGRDGPVPAPSAPAPSPRGVPPALENLLRGLLR